MISNLLTIGITTKNRWSDLEITLQKLEKLQYHLIPIIVFDDNSDTVCPFDIKQFNLNIELQRFNQSQGYIFRRNQLAKIIKTKYYLSLDDDSYPVSEGLESALTFAESHNNLLCVSFPIYNPVLGQYQNQSFETKPYQVRSFIGCGHLLHIENFLKLGGYREILIHQGEEMDIAARGFQQGFYCYHFPDLLIHHTASNEGRNWYRMDFYGSRNNVFWNDWFVPNELKVYKQLRTLISRLILTVKVRRLGLITGEIWAFKNLAKYAEYRKTMSKKLYSEWTKLRFS
ncbi:glycosyltransferase family 2 protein [Geminocystis sp. CENA526]|uniref:glycosyltransferase family 2 protein n=1 Tax=Geminocystis sp. CENA526 TaxID=1355871 RepID=UPI003D6E558B